MKKYIIALFIGFSLISSHVSAQTVTPTDTQTADIQALQQVIYLLVQQVQVLLAQLAQVQATQNSLNTQITQVLTPQTSMASVPVSTPQPIEIKTGDYITGWGGNCGISTISVFIKYSNDKYLSNGETIDVYFPDGTMESYKDNNGRDKEFVDYGRYMSTIMFNPTTHFSKDIVSTTTKLLIVKNNLKKEVTLELKPRIIDKDNPHLIYQTSGVNVGKYVEDSSSRTYNPFTYQCDY